MSLFQAYKKAILLGCIVGLIAPVIGLFLGLQVSTFLGTILMLPFIMLGSIIGEAFGNFSTLQTIISFACSMLLWASIFVAITRLKK